MSLTFLPRFRRAAALAALSVAVAAPFTAQAQDAAAGKRVFMRCAACHTVNPGGPNRIGPNLSGVVGRKSAQAKGFNYSPAMAKANVKWDEATLDKYLTRPSAHIPGTKMVFVGLPNPADRKAVIAYLKSPTP